jgi:putative salt-induced outer membrane protein YdiY
MRSWKSSLPLSLAIAAAAASSALADTVKLKNGDVLTGRIVDVIGGKVTLKTDAAGDVKIDLAQVDTISTDAPITIELKDGTIIVVKAAAAKDGRLVVEGEGVERRELVLADVVSVNKPSRRWTGNLLGAGTWTRGNSESTAISVDAHAENRGDVDRITADAWYRATRTKDETTGDESTSVRRTGAAAKYDCFFAETKAYAYGNTLAEKDAIADIDLRFIAGAGAGCQIADTPNTKFSGEAGLAWLYENYSGGTDTASDPTVRVATRFQHDFNEHVQLFDDFDAYKALNGSDWLVHNKGGLREKLTGSLFAQQWIESTWDSTPAAGKERRDVIYYVGIGWSF